MASAHWPWSKQAQAAAGNVSALGTMVLSSASLGSDPYVPMKSGVRRRYVTLDLLRGEAAIGVMLFHNCVGIVQSGYLAVDLFFVLSGFVIALSYEDRLQDGLAKSSFFLARFIRLWPMIAVGSILGLLAGLAHYEMHSGNLQTLGLQFLASLVLFPDLLETGDLFPLNTVFWSLLFEVIVNAIYAGWFYGRPARVASIVLVVVSAICVVIEPESRMLTLFVRALLGFFMGVLAYRVYKSFKLPAVKHGAILCSVAIILILVIPTPEKQTGVLFLFVDALFFAVVLIAAKSDATVSDRASIFCQWIGDISYPIYAIHRPLFYFFSVIIVRLTHGLAAYNLAALIASAVTVIVSSALLRLFDQPVRRYLTDLTRPMGSRPKQLERSIASRKLPTAQSLD